MSTYRAFLAVIFATSGACFGGSATGTCGDGLVEADEACDDGNVVAGDGCSATCTAEDSKCGNGEVNVATETCDDGNTVSGDGCSSTCRDECGNGQLDGNEACDDGNRDKDDGCSGACIVETGYTCTGEPSDCITPTGMCSDPYIVALTDNMGTLSGMGMGDTTMGMDQIPEGACDGFTSGAGFDHIWQLTLMEERDVTITIDSGTSFDAALRVLQLACDPTSEVIERIGEDGCADSFADEELVYSRLPAGTYFIVIDSYSTDEKGTYSFRVIAEPTKCGNGMLDGVEVCDDANTITNDGCSASCDVEAGYACHGEPSVCGSACGNGHLNMGEECDDMNTVPGDRCSATCLLEQDLTEVEPNDVTPQVLQPTDRLVRGSLVDTDVDLYSFTLAVPSTVELEVYDSMDPDDDYDGAGMVTVIDCDSTDTELRLFDAAGDPAMEMTALATDDEDGDNSCSYLGPGDTDGPNMMEGVLQPGTYTVKVNNWSSFADTERYILELRIASTQPVGPIPGDLVLNEFMAGDNASDTNCDGVTTGTGDEFIELVNVSSKVLDLTGVTIADSVVLRHTFAPGPTGSMMLAPGQSVVVWSAGAPACPGVTNWFVASSTQLGLNDLGDTITIKNAAAVELIRVMYPAVTLNMSRNLAPDVTGTVYANHNTLTGAVGAWSPGKRANGTAF